LAEEANAFQAGASDGPLDVVSKGGSVDLRLFINLLATVFGAWGALYVLKGVVSLSARAMMRLAQTGFDFSTPLVRSLSGEWADAIIGMSLVVLAFVLAFTTLAFVPEGRWAWSSAWGALLAGGLMVLFFYLLLRFLRERLYSRRVRDIGRSLVAFYVEHFTKPGSEIESGYKTIEHCAREFLDMEPGPEEEPWAFLERAAEVAGVALPPKRVEPDRT